VAVLRFAADEGTLSAWYHDHRLPLRARSYAAVIRRQLARGNGTPLDDAVRIELTRIADAFDRVRRASRRRRDEAHCHAAQLKSELAAVCRQDAAAARFMDDAAAAFGGTPGDADSFRPLPVG
jgi:maltooligosyltrehalose synthase